MNKLSKEEMLTAGLTIRSVFTDWVEYDPSDPEAAAPEDVYDTSTEDEDWG